jgi:hypothetical protein
MNKYCYLLHLVGLDFIILPTLKMHGQTKIKFKSLTVLREYVQNFLVKERQKNNHLIQFRSIPSLLICRLSRQVAYNINNNNNAGPCSGRPRGLRRSSAPARLLRLWVRITPGAWMSVCCECCVLSGKGLCDGLITRPEESYRKWRVVVFDQETTKTRRLKPATGL